MEVINIETWNRKEHYEHFSSLADPYFGLTIPFDVSKAYQFAKTNKVSFFAKYLHDCMKAINDVDELKLRIVNSQVVKYDVIHASPTIMRDNHTFGFSFVEFDYNLNTFINNFEGEKLRINTSTNLYPPNNSLDCIHCSAMPWLEFSGHKEPVSRILDSVPKLAFSKVKKETHNKLKMNVAINVNHALVDGYHVSLFAEKFQQNLNK
ncbi:CatA-like O-acetyltransferase [Ichthyenterobacterium magnum]|uniref:Chloramphenicol O-acetyltransferase type A n=1 Tax=Ichthyenterobacterium magnum TaxID=1230530 RepID=A0A420DKG6_9FLAO|nr:CatA-like O-acetyltransferase [Ichthyenterobacterium magnum]RKE94685.1 chloramphenicol O-acetyltransferase type A [Ichthyenterobacterium magnum]